ncbi:nuclear transport factor 2 family protein [Sporosarcina thermotolerans]|uniref:Nuclear transport factor 2 family protein n=1 Tax=Sporosarcina thermotolerans TaxID=633404 RepID=A0AAW9A900_9BACL|nr:nuclear transport factor 2 family protein [Sporosarcina thermotolerans]MDW0117667.1 nuclear transport factor 2 family protein [Sporosarcina thermotolerans]WHT49241.1 nuclear transport factor 2 family protein [Sporosarcina thermotolerans]
MDLLKEQAVNFLQLVVAGKIDEAYETYVSPDLRHHNPYFPGDMESLKQAMKENDGMSPNKTLEVKQSIEEGNRVMVFSHIKQNPEDFGGAAVHIFRFEAGKIVEMWDVGQAVQEDSPNENGIF